MKFSIKDVFSKCDQILFFLRILSNLLKKSLMENFIFVQWLFTAVQNTWKCKGLGTSKYLRKPETVECDRLFF